MEEWAKKRLEDVVTKETWMTRYNLVKNNFTPYYEGYAREEVETAVRKTVDNQDRYNKRAVDEKYLYPNLQYNSVLPKRLRFTRRL